MYDNYFSFLIDVGAYITNSCSLLKTEKKVPSTAQIHFVSFSHFTVPDR